MVTLKNIWKITNEDFKRALEKRKDVFEIWNETKIVDYKAMVRELSKRSGLSESICKKVYDAEDSILIDLGLMNSERVVSGHYEKKQ